MVQIIYKKDLALQLQLASNLEQLCRITGTVRWKKLWDQVLDHGEACTTSLKTLVQVMSHPLHASRSCPLCEITELKETLLVHVINEHTNSNESWDTLCTSLLNLDPSIYRHVLMYYAFTIFFSHYCLLIILLTINFLHITHLHIVVLYL